MQEKFKTLIILGRVIKVKIVMMCSVFDSDITTSHLFISKNLTRTA